MSGWLLIILIAGAAVAAVWLLREAGQDDGDDQW